MVDGHRPNPIRHGENLFATFEADVAQHHKPYHNMSSHINEETLQLAANGSQYPHGQHYSGPVG